MDPRTPSPHRRRNWARLVGVIGLLAVLWAFASWGVSAGAWSPQTLAAEARAAGVWGPAVMMGLMVMAVLVAPVPTLPISVTAGLVYGPFWGTVIAVAGATLGALGAFWLARWAGRGAVARWLGGHTAFCPDCSDRTLFGLVLLARLVPVVSFALVSYAAGLTAMRAPAFALATVIGMLPMTVVYVALGATLELSTTAVVIATTLVVVLVLVGPYAVERVMPGTAARLRTRWHGQRASGGP